MVQVDLGDRPVRITLVRTWAALSLWQKAKFVWCLVYSGINVPDAEELSKMVEEMKVEPPCTFAPRASHWPHCETVRGLGF